MIIEQSREQVDQAIAFHTRSEIGYLRVANARIWSRESISKASSDASFDINFKPGVFSIENHAVLLQTDFLFTITDAIPEKTQERQPVVVIECCFEAQYNLAPDYTPSENEIEAFRMANAVFNCWPFFREFVQASSMRMHFPPPSIPFLRLVRKSETPHP